MDAFVQLVLLYENSRSCARPSGEYAIVRM